MESWRVWVVVWFVLGVVWVAGRSADEWKSRTIYQLLIDRFGNAVGKPGCGDLGDYCGGTFQGVIQHLDYISGMGFDAIWISPVVENTAKGYHGYFARDFYEINHYFGTAADLKQLVEACHQRDIWVMIDIVANHVGPVGDDFSQINPFNSSSDYHPDCTIQEPVCFTNQTLTCRLGTLPDLNQSNPKVRSQLLQWIKWLMQTFSFDGIRADTLIYIDQEFWAEFTAASGSYIVGEATADVTCNAAYQKFGVSATLSYPMFYILRSVFQNQYSMKLIESEIKAYQSFPNVYYLGNFIDNHDQPRFLNATQAKQEQYFSAITFVLFSAGIPIIYYGTEQGFHGGVDPYCREPLWVTNYNTQTEYYQFLTKLIKIRKLHQIWQNPQAPLFSSNNFFAFTRGQLLITLTNSNQPVTQTFQIDSYPNGTKLCNLLSLKIDCISVSNGNLTVTIQNGMPNIYFPSPA